MKRFILLVIVITLCVILVGCQIIATEEKIDVTATVVDIEYKSSYITMMPISNGKTISFFPQTHPARYLVTIAYDDVSETFNDRNLYETVKKGDTIQMILCKSYDQEGNLINQTLQFAE